MAQITSDASGSKDEKVTTILADDLEIQGTIKFKSSLMIKGVLNGVVLSEGLLIVGPSAKVTATIATKNLISHGEIQGDVDASEQIILKNTAIHNGNITTRTIVIEKGSIFNGACMMKREPVAQTADTAIAVTTVKEEAVEASVAEAANEKVKVEKAEEEKETVVSHGEIQGDVDASKQSILKNAAVHNGNITTPDIAIESGSLFNGAGMMKREPVAQTADTAIAVTTVKEEAVEASVAEEETAAEAANEKVDGGRGSGRSRKTSGKIKD